jgi:hypothetical protein
LPSRLPHGNKAGREFLDLSLDVAATGAPLDAIAVAAFKREVWGAARRVTRSAGAIWRAYAGWVLPLASLGFVIAWVTIYTPYNNGPPIRSDGTGYHAWTRALLDKDLSFCRWNDAVESFISVRNKLRNFCQNQYPPGLALLRFPVMAFLVDVDNPDVIPITRGEHQASLILGGVFLWLQAALLVWAAALLRLPAWRSSAAVLFALFGTGLFHYGTYDSSFSHVYSSFFCALLLLLAVREQTTGRRMSVVLLALSAFFLTSLRNTNVFLLAELAGAYLIWQRSTPWPRLVLQKLVPLGIGAGVVIGLQLAYNYMAAGSLTVNSYGEEESFLWNRPMQREVLFSYERGLFTYYPVFALALVAGFAVRRARPAASLLLILTATYTILYGYWHSWALGAGMGHRGFVEIVPVVALVLCLALSSLRPRELYPALAAGVVLCAVTVQVMYGYWFSTFHVSGDKQTSYWAHMHTLESFAAGGSTCKPARCEIWQWNCVEETAPQYSFCLENFKHTGVCFDGQCAPIIALRWDQAGERRYISAPPPHKGNKPLLIAASEIGPWERFLLISEPNQPRGLRLMSLHTKRYVSSPQVGDNPRSLVSGVIEPREHELFVRRGVGTRIYLKAWNNRFVTPVRYKDRLQLKASAEKATSKEAFDLEYVRTQY